MSNAFPSLPLKTLPTHNLARQLGLLGTSCEGVRVARVVGLPELPGLLGPVGAKPGRVWRAQGCI